MSLLNAVITCEGAILLVVGYQSAEATCTCLLLSSKAESAGMTPLHSGKPVTNERQVCKLADSLEEYAETERSKRQARALVGAVCMNEHSIRGVVTGFTSDTFSGVTLEGGHVWSSKHPVKVADNLYKYTESLIKVA